MGEDLGSMGKTFFRRGSFRSEAPGIAVNMLCKVGLGVDGE